MPRGLQSLLDKDLGSTKVRARCKESILQCIVSHKEIELKKFSGKTLLKNCRNLSTSLKCFACFYYHWKKNWVQSLYVKRHSLLSLNLGCTLAKILTWISIWYTYINEKKLLSFAEGYGAVRFTSTVMSIVNCVINLN